VAQGFAAFLDAAKRGDRDAVRVTLAENPAMARASDDTGDTALHRAAEIGDLEMIEELIAAGAAIDAARADGHRPVHCALHWGRKTQELALDAARLLLKRGAEYTIYLAAAFGDVESVRAVLQRDRSQANHADTSGGGRSRPQRGAKTSRWSSCCSNTARIRICRRTARP
jgi:ankyrin repeat protein